MYRKEIPIQLEATLRHLYPDALVKGSQLCFDEVDFFLEQCVVTTKPDGETSQQRVIAIVAADWARFAQNYNYKVSNSWFGWHDRMKQARAKLAHLPEGKVEDEAKKLVKQELIQRYDKETCATAQNKGSFLVEHADWNQIDTLAKSICEKLEIQPDQLTLLMVAGTQNQSPSPQIQGLCRHGHELRFCLLDDLESTMTTSCFYERETSESMPCEMPALDSKSKRPNLREMLQASSKRIQVVEKATAVGLKDIIILNIN